METRPVTYLMQIITVKRNSENKNHRQIKSTVKHSGFIFKHTLKGVGRGAELDPRKEIINILKLPCFENS
jgi:hypothetical protein